MDKFIYSDRILSCLSSSEQGDTAAQTELCQLFYESHEAGMVMPEGFWDRIQKLADDNLGYANFILHFKYLDNPKQHDLAYSHIRKAARATKNPLAYLQLGKTYTYGIGTKPNQKIANYYFMRSTLAGCKEAYDFILQKTEAGEKYYGILSHFCKVIDVFYPQYNKDKAIDDILNYRTDSIDADILFATSSPTIEGEVEIEAQESILLQLFAPIMQDEELCQRIKAHDPDKYLSNDEQELLECIDNLNCSYDEICAKHGIEKKALLSREVIDSFPYIRVRDMSRLRKQAFRCLLSIKDAIPTIQTRVLESLDDVDLLLDNISRYYKEETQVFLISFVELNVDIDDMEIGYLSLLKSFRNNSKQELADFLNKFLQRLSYSDIEYDLPDFTIENLPPIDLSPRHIKESINPSYSFHLSPSGEVMMKIYLDSDKAAPQSPFFIHDGIIATFKRSDSSIVHVNYMSPETIVALNKQTELLVVEERSHETIREYKADIKKVAKIVRLSL